LEESSGRSTMNKTEVQVAVALFNRLRKDFSSVDFSSRVGVVSMYSAQIKELKRVFEQRFGREILNEVDFRTVDGFQGQEKDIIILSCVRGGPGVVSIGHVKDVRRMNVAITRAKSSLFILGNAATLERSNETWGAIINDSKSRKFFDEVDASYFTAPAAPTVSSRAPVSQRSKQVSKPPMVTPVPVPVGLATPKELKAAMQNGLPASTTTAPEPRDQPMLNNPSDKQKGKRKQEEMTSDPKETDKPLLSASTSATSAPPPVPAPRKRTKQAPNLFIPKGKNKRP